ncbi:UDP-galactopyranose mutase [Coraliomargarita sinensis]|uniref:UDP-galactopyranose mutase n=1 Tax=Coraliomargarita sinensis TaxID=2174842 RepID=A0A317ZE56_9BACT|nr:UDP-galactopyranose mutase [Coraliomargarita sinensis]PXA03684.1 UDP-galactopyranose mutase [Coraliomargarita sinensis]
MHKSFDFLVVGAGFSGLVAAERLCTQHGKRCLVVEKRDHIGGNAHDCYDEHGVLIHPYGPHYFRTNSDDILGYLSQFTEWMPGNYKVQVYRDDRYWSFPINLRTFEQYIGREATAEEMEAWLKENRTDFEAVTNSEEAVLSQVGEAWYKMFFEGYTLKQWKRHPRELSPSVCRRIPVRTNRDDRYFNDKYQVLPKHGYHTLFNNLVKACGDRLEVRLNLDYKEVIANESIQWQHMIFTGPIDAYFDYKFGPLPYRSLRFEHEHFSAKALRGIEDGSSQLEGKTPSPDPHLPSSGLTHQPCVQVNYPESNLSYTRTVEAKHITGQEIEGTTIVREYPEDYEVGKEPYYPIPAAEARQLYKRYEDEAGQLDDVSFIGRLGTYRYYNMDQVVGMALKFVEKLNPFLIKHL